MKRPVAAVMLVLAVVCGLTAAATSRLFLAEALRALVFGFVPFLVRNVPRISWNADTFVPGFLAFAAVCAVGHHWLRRIARRRERAWRISHTLALTLFLPLVFVTAFIVPGVELQVRLLWEIPLIEPIPGA